MNNEMLEIIQGQIGYRFKNTDLLQQAFVRRSYSKMNGGENNEVLEFIGDKALDFIIVKKLAEKYVKENQYTYSGMLKTLKWYYEKEGHSLDKSNGSIGIMPYIYKQALNYYYTLYQAQLVNQEKDLSNFTLPKERIINIESPRVFIRPPHMWLQEDDE